MAGLLYKDFVAFCGKRWILSLLAITALLTIPCFTGAGAEVVLVLQSSVLTAAGILLLAVPMYFETCIFSTDEGRKKKAALLSFPISGRQYVASKYLFVLLLYYVLLSFAVIWANIMCAWEGYEESIVEMMGLLPSLACLLLILSALEMPFFVALGIRAGNSLKTTIAMILFFLLVGYGLFGDLTILDHVNLALWVEYLKEHRETALALQTFGPIVSGGLYYLSYRVAGGVFVRGELRDEE